ncbi:MAG: RIO1 family regulatory kinase/ATPase domain-containing protein [Candidatus Asgardarchaeia archaeon]
MSYVEKEDIAIMRIIDGLREVFEWVPEESITEKLPYGKKDISFRLKKLDKLKLIEYRYIDSLASWCTKLLERGFDTLALWDFKKHKVLDKIGDVIGVGKEASIIGALSPSGEWLIVKFHRWWKREFRKIRKSLSYASIVVRGEELKLSDREVDIPRAKAQIEFNALQKAKAAGINVPDPISINRHAIVTKMIERGNGVPAPQLVDIRLENPREAYEIILEDYVKLVNDAKIIHGDFNEYNILVSPEGELYYIDFPQSVPVSYPASLDMAIRDLNQINNYFSSKYRIDVYDLNEILDELKIKGARSD